MPGELIFILLKLPFSVSALLCHSLVLPHQALLGEESCRQLQKLRPYRIL